MSLLEKAPSSIALAMILLSTLAASPASAAQTLKQIREECRRSHRLPGKERQMLSQELIKKCIQGKTKRHGKKTKRRRKKQWKGH